jgi:L-2-hydroxyglutarate oxidase
MGFSLSANPQLIIPSPNPLKAMLQYTFAIIGGGIVGLSTAMALGQQYPDARILVLEKESGWAYHQTGRNSGVIHSGLYYQPGSLKAELCRNGNRSMVAFCQQHGIEYELCGKVIVATDPAELPRLDRLYERGLQNGVNVDRLSGDAIRDIEPYVNCIAGLRVHSAGIVNYRQVCETYVNIIQRQGGDLRLNTKVENLIETPDGYNIETNQGTFTTQFLINCAGLHSDRMARLGQAEPNAKIIPIRGEYYELKPEKRYLVHHLIYPLPDPNMPVLGVHFTRMIDGTIHAGPNAVLSLKREGYRKTDIDLRDIAEVLTYSGFWNMMTAYWDTAIQELIRSLSKAAFVRSLQRLIPDVQADDLIPSPAGVRAQAVKPDGRFVDDFLLVRTAKAMHVCNAPSPAATASIEIGKAIVTKLSSSVEDAIDRIRTTIP